MQQLDIQTIIKNISEKHESFLEELGAHSDRVLAEHNLLMELTFTRINYICEAFQDQKIIDTIKHNEGSNPARKILLSKGGYDNYVSITTNGERIVIDGASYLTSMGVCSMDDKVILENVNSDDFDWIGFSDKLLDMIHSIIYERKEALETKVWGIS